MPNCLGIEKNRRVTTTKIINAAEKRETSEESTHTEGLLIMASIPREHERINVPMGP
jgi:hypothetical protein